MCESTVAGLIARRNNVLASKCEYTLSVTPLLNVPKTSLRIANLLRRGIFSTAESFGFVTQTELGALGIPCEWPRHAIKDSDPSLRSIVDFGVFWAGAHIYIYQEREIRVSVPSPPEKFMGTNDFAQFSRKIIWHRGPEQI